MKKFFIFLSILLILFLIGLGIGFMFFRAPTDKPMGDIVSTVGNFFPFGKPPQATDTSTTDILQPGSASEEADLEPQKIEAPPIRKIAIGPVSGATFIGTSTVRYIERATGHIFDIKVDEDRGTRISNTTFPKVQEAYFTESGRSVLLQTLSENSRIETLYVRFQGDEEFEATSITLPGNIRGISISPSSESMFYISEGEGGVLSGVDGTGKRTIFNTPAREWNSTWNSPTTITLLTKPSGLVSGSAFGLRSSSGILTPILQNIPGLTINPNKDASGLIYSQTSGRSFSLHYYDSLNQEAVPLLIQTLPEKCVWSGEEAVYPLYCAVPTAVISGVYPDVWYQGLQSFNDTLFGVNPATGQLEELDRAASESFDAINLQVSNDGKHLLFTNKKDLSLWLVRLTEEGSE